jgi:hypothetical protein
MYSIKPFAKLMLSKFPTVDPNPDDYKKCVAVRLGVIYDSQATHREQGVSRTPISCLGVIHDSQPAKLHKKPPQKGGSSYFLLEKLPETEFFLLKPLTRYNYKTFCKE